MPRRFDQINGEPQKVGLTGSAVLMLAFDVSEYEQMRLVVNQLGGPDDVENVVVEASIFPEASYDLDDDRDWVTVANLASFTPSGNITRETSSTVVLPQGTGNLSVSLWQHLRISAWSTAGTDVLARADFMGATWDK